MTPKYKIAITTGDIDGIGLEVTAKALARLKPSRQVQLIFFRSSRSELKQLKKIDKVFFRHQVSSLKEGLSVPHRQGEIVEVVTERPPAECFKAAVRSCLSKDLQGIVTAPMSKAEGLKSTTAGLGHTEILKRLCKTQKLYMGFVGKHFNVVLCTGHLPLKSIARKLNSEVLFSSICAAKGLQECLSAAKSKKPLALLGLNPHAGEAGLIGEEELELFKPTLDLCKKNNIQVDGPLVPDAAFFKQNWQKYSIYVCPYHDQGLIPFKMVHGQDSGVHITLGLPFVRTSVDHGTAKNIFGKNQANPQSMLEAILWAIKLCKGS